MNLHPLELRWLNTQGDRNSTDVMIDEIGKKFVYMYAPGGKQARVYLPSVEYLMTVKWNSETWRRKKTMVEYSFPCL